MSCEINLEQKIDYKGYWYLPSSPENKIAGVLTYHVGNKIELALIGCFNSSTSLLGREEESVIYGKTSDAKDITLFQCYSNSKVNFNAEFPIVKYNCNFIIIGKHINSLEEKAQYWVRFKIPELTYWCHPKALTYNVKFNNDSKTNQKTISFNSTYNNKESIIREVKINNNTTIQIKKGIDFESTNMLLNPKLKQYTYIEIIKQSQSSINELLSDIRTFEHFISFATLNIVQSTNITFFDKNIFQQCNSEYYYREIHFICPSSHEKNINTQKECTNFLFQYSTIEDIYPKFIQNWYNVPTDLFPIRTHLISSLEKKTTYSSVDFLIIIQAIEGFWWRFRDNAYKAKNSIPKKQNTYLNTILTELSNEFNNIELLNKNKINIVAVVDSRNYYSHFMEQNKKPNKLKGWPLIEEEKKLRILLICCFLSFIGLENIQIDTIFKTNNHNLI